MKFVNELVDGEHIRGQFLVVNMNKGASNVGTQYLNIELRDATGSIGAKKWEILPEDENVIVPGNVIEVDGEVLKYKDNLQIKVLSVSSLDSNSIDITRFVKSAPIPLEDLKAKLKKYINEIQDEDYLKLVKYFVKKYADKLCIYPAGVAVHHEYSSGLLMHETTMLEIAEHLLPIYPEVDKDLLYAGIILHDLGKTIELEGPVIYHYTVEGKLLGHISIMNGELTKACEELNIDHEKSILIRHMILAHHGQYEFGSPVLPLTKEALLLSMIDNLDSKMVVALKALEVTKEGEFTSKIFPLDGRTLYKQTK